MEKDLKVIYMFNGLIMIAEKVANAGHGLHVRQALALAPGQQQGVMSLMEAFPFTSMDEVIQLEAGSYITMSEVDENKVREAYLDALTQIRSKKAGIILP
jgi:hypothetical protein